jgi:hypothetical protein
VPRIYLLHVAALLLSAGHHLDHVLRGTHVGWPAIPQVTTFTYTLAIYPIIGLGFLLRSRAYWLIAATGGLLLLAGVHFGPFAVEQPREILGGYAQPLIGYVAFAVLLALVVVLLAIVRLYARGGRTAFTS